MSSYIKSDSTSENSQETKKSWIKPAIIYLGNATTLIKGGGKVGSVADADPQSTFKSGVG